MSDGIVRTCVASIACFVRGLPLFVAAAPRTPLRALGIIAFDTLHVLRHSRRLPAARIRDVATFLDFAGCANAAWDRKELSGGDYHTLRERLEGAGHGPSLTDYLRRLRALEWSRAGIGGDARRFDEVRSYREAVARLTLAAAAAIAADHDGLDQAVDAIERDGDLATLFCILMQCQIVDDVIDYREDAAAGLPSFLTATASLPEAIELTAAAARHYAASRENASGRGIVPFRVALALATALAKLVIRVAACVAARAGVLVWRSPAS